MTDKGRTRILFFNANHMKTIISLPDSLFYKAEAVAKELEISRSKLYERALAAYLKKHKDEQIIARFNEV